MSLGLLRAGWRPDNEVCVVRAVVRQREVLLTEQASWVQRMQKVLLQIIRCQSAQDRIKGSALNVVPEDRLAAVVYRSTSPVQPQRGHGPRLDEMRT